MVGIDGKSQELKSLQSLSLAVCIWRVQACLTEPLEPRIWVPGHARAPALFRGQASQGKEAPSLSIPVDFFFLQKVVSLGATRFYLWKQFSPVFHLIPEVHFNR